MRPRASFLCWLVCAGVLGAGANARQCRGLEHIAFGGGVHFCLGVHIARVEIQAILRELLTRLPDLEPSGDPKWLDSNFISGPKHLPVRFSPS